MVFLHDLNERDEATKAWEDLVRVNPMAKVQSDEPVMEMISNIKEKKTP